jgi:hypothetical protein
MEKNHSTFYTDLDQGSKVIIFETILTTFMAIIVFVGHWEVAKIGLSLKSNHDKQF